MVKIILHSITNPLHYFGFLPSWRFVISLFDAWWRLDCAVYFSVPIFGSYLWLNAMYISLFFFSKLNQCSMVCTCTMYIGMGILGLTRVCFSPQIPAILSLVCNWRETFRKINVCRWFLMRPHISANICPFVCLYVCMTSEVAKNE